MINLMTNFATSKGRNFDLFSSFKMAVKYCSHVCYGSVVLQSPITEHSAASSMRRARWWRPMVTPCRTTRVSNERSWRLHELLQSLPTSIKYLSTYHVMFKFMNSVLSEAPSRGLFCDCEIFANLRLKLYEPPSSRVPGPGVPCPVGQPGVCRYLPPVDIYRVIADI